MNVRTWVIVKLHFFFKTPHSCKINNVFALLKYILIRWDYIAKNPLKFQKVPFLNQLKYVDNRLFWLPVYLVFISCKRILCDLKCLEFQLIAQVFFQNKHNILK